MVWLINASMSFAWLTLVRQLRVQYVKQVLLHFGWNLVNFGPLTALSLDSYHQWLKPRESWLGSNELKITVFSLFKCLFRVKKCQKDQRWSHGVAVKLSFKSISILTPVNLQSQSAYVFWLCPLPRSPLTHFMIMFTTKNGQQSPFQ